MSSPIATLTHEGIPSSLARIAQQGGRVVVALVRAIAHRRDVKRLLELDDRELKDIGLLRGDVLGALSEPLGTDPSIVLRLRSVERRAHLRALQAGERRLAYGTAR